MLVRTAGALLLSAALLAGCGRRDDQVTSTTQTSLPAGDSSVSSTAPVMGGATQVPNPAGVVAVGGANTAAVSPPATASGSLAVSPAASASAGTTGTGVGPIATPGVAGIAPTAVTGAQTASRSGIPVLGGARGANGAGAATTGGAVGTGVATSPGAAVGVAAPASSTGSAPGSVAAGSTAPR